MDLPLDYSGSNSMSPPAIYQVYTEEEVQHAYSLYQGSGGNITSMFSISLSGTKTQIIQEPLNKLASTVNVICDAFGLTKDELTKICHIQSRKTLYNWIDGKTNPRKSAMSRVFDLLTIAQAWQHAGFSGDRALLCETVLDGQNLFDILNQEKIDKELVLFIGSRLNTMAVSNAITDPFA